MRATLLILIFLNAILLPLGIDLPQENPEELFLTDESFNQLLKMKQEFGRHDLVFLSKVKTEQADNLSSLVEDLGGEFSPLTPLLTGHAVMEIPPMGDATRFGFLNKISEKYPELTFAGEAYTNSQLAGMSLRIQQVLFPLVFGLILIGILILTKDIPVSAYLFLSALLGTNIGLTFVRFIYGHTTILTNLTPLIAFILTLGVQLHVVYGLNRYKDKAIFHDLKIRPILMMMVTTILGFLSLITSDLPGIRQLAITSSLTLTTTWTILLLLLRWKLPEVSLKNTFWKRRQWKPLKAVPVVGYLILIFLTLGGSLALLKMPVLVEAIHFFPKNHPVQTGYEDISKGLGGTPQFDIFISRKDKAPLAYSDFSKVERFEENLITEFNREKLLSLIQLTKFANEKYTKERILPDNEISFQMLAGRIPSILRNHLASESVLRISIVSKLLSVEERKEMEERARKVLSTIDPTYEARIGGLTHLILQSQTGLVKSLINSFILSFLIISIIFALFSRDLKATLIFSFLNFASIMGGLFFMWITGFTLNVSSVMTVSISMGLVVDSTIHLMHGKKMGEEPDAIYFTTIVPIILSHILLFAAFGCLSLESFIPIRDFSLGLVILLLVGLICDLFVLPMLSKD